MFARQQDGVMFGLQGMDVNGNLKPLPFGIGAYDLDYFINFGDPGSTLLKNLIGDVEVFGCTESLPPPRRTRLVDRTGAPIAGATVLINRDTVLTTEAGTIRMTDSTFDAMIELVALPSEVGHVTTLDLAEVQRHILALQTMDQEVKVLAADVNLDGRVSGSDVVDMRKVALDIDRDFDGVAYLLYVPESSSQLSQSMLLTAQEQLAGTDIVVVRLGDINGR